jgi:hypothetical protein
MALKQATAFFNLCTIALILSGCGGKGSTGPGPQASPAPGPDCSVAGKCLRLKVDGPEQACPQPNGKPGQAWYIYNDHTQAVRVDIIETAIFLNRNKPQISWPVAPPYLEARGAGAATPKFLGCKYVHTVENGSDYTDQHDFALGTACFAADAVSCAQKKTSPLDRLPTPPTPPSPNLDCVSICRTNDPECVKVNIVSGNQSSFGFELNAIGKQLINDSPPYDIAPIGINSSATMLLPNCEFGQFSVNSNNAFSVPVTSCDIRFSGLAHPRGHTNATLLFPQLLKATHSRSQIPTPFSTLDMGQSSISESAYVFFDSAHGAGETEKVEKITIFPNSWILTGATSCMKLILD